MLNFETVLHDIKSTCAKYEKCIEMRISSNGKRASFYFYKSLGFWMETQKSGVRFEFPEDTKADIAAITTAAHQKKTGEYQVPVDGFFNYEQFLKEVLVICIDCRSNASFERPACCHLFEKCSDAGHCLFEESFENWDFLGCYYKINLEAGRIFYGKNKNVMDDA